MAHVTLVRVGFRYQIWICGRVHESYSHLEDAEREAHQLRRDLGERLSFGRFGGEDTATIVPPPPPAGE